MASRSADLPAWIFDVEDSDAIDMQNKSLLQELEIDPQHISRMAKWALVAPLYRVFGKRILERHPLRISKAEASRGLTAGSSDSSSIDFWGPCGVVSLYLGILWLADVKHVAWVYLIWALTALFNHLVSRVWFSASALILHLAVMGYSVGPTIVLSSLLLLLRPPLWIALSVQCFAATWAAFSAILSYIAVIQMPSEGRHHLALLIPPVLLMHLYLLSILPLRYYVN